MRKEERPPQQADVKRRQAEPRPKRLPDGQEQGEQIDGAAGRESQQRHTQDEDENVRCPFRHIASSKVLYKFIL